MKNGRNQTIDLMKFIMSLFIIGVHAQLFKNTNLFFYQIITQGLLRIAVPLFFIVSGYYFYQRVQSGREVKSFFVKLLKLFLIFEIIEIFLYLPFSSVQERFDITLFFWRAMSVGLSGAYWYIISLGVSLATLISSWKKKKIMSILILGFLFYLMMFTADSYAGFFKGTSLQDIAFSYTKIWTWPQAGISSSFFYVSLGAFIYETKIKLKVSIFAVFLSLGLLMSEAFFLQNHGALESNCYLSLFICVPILFLYLLQHPQTSFDTRLLGSMSLYIYMSHAIYMTIVRYKFPLFSQNDFQLFLVTSIFSIITAYFIVWSKQMYSKIVKHT